MNTQHRLGAQRGGERPVQLRTHAVQLGTCREGEGRTTGRDTRRLDHYRKITTIKSIPRGPNRTIGNLLHEKHQVFIPGVLGAFFFVFCFFQKACPRRKFFLKEFRNDCVCMGWGEARRESSNVKKVNPKEFHQGRTCMQSVFQNYA